MRIVVIAMTAGLAGCISASAAETQQEMWRNIHEECLYAAKKPREHTECIRTQLELHLSMGPQQVAPPQPVPPVQDFADRIERAGRFLQGINPPSAMPSPPPPPPIPQQTQCSFFRNQVVCQTQ